MRHIYWHNEYELRGLFAFLAIMLLGAPREHDQLSKENAILVKKMNDYVKDFISTNYNNVLGPGVFMMLCSSLPYPVMTPQIEEIINNAPPTFQNNPLIRDFLVKAKENMQLIDEHRRMEENIAIKQQNQGDVKLP